MPEVSQSARNAAANLHTATGRDEVAALTLAGALEMLPTVQAFARFEAEIRAEATTGADALVVQCAREVDIQALTRYVREHAGRWSSPSELDHINALSRLKAALSAIDEGRGG